MKRTRLKSIIRESIKRTLLNEAADPIGRITIEQLPGHTRTPNNYSNYLKSVAQDTPFANVVNTPKPINSASAAAQTGAKATTQASTKAASNLWGKTTGWLSKGGNNLLGKMGNMGKFGKWGAAAALAGAGLYGAHKLYDYGQEPDKTGGYPEPSMPQMNPYGYGYGYPYMMPQPQMPQMNPYGYGYDYPYMMPQMNPYVYGYPMV